MEINNDNTELLETHTHPIKRLKDLGCLPRSDGRFKPIKELSISHFPRTVYDFLKLLLLPGLSNEKRFVWVTENVFLMGRCDYYLENNFQPSERIPLCYITVYFSDKYNDGWFCRSPPTYSPTRWWMSKDRITGKISICALSADDTVSVLETLAQLPDKHDFLWQIDLSVLKDPDHIRRVFECLPTTVRRDFTFIGEEFEAELCSLVLSPRGSRIRHRFVNCLFDRRAQEACLHAVAAREDTDDHRLCLRLEKTKIQTQNFIRLLDSNKVDSLELDYDLDWLDNECIQALTRSQLRRFDLSPEWPQYDKFVLLLNSLPFGQHLKELALHSVILEGKENNCLVTILRNTPNLLHFGIMSSRLSQQQQVELMDAIQMHPSLTSLNLSGCWS